MFSSDRVLTLDVGASKVVLAEFNVKNSALPVLTKVASHKFDGNNGQDVNFATLAAEGIISQLMQMAGIEPAPLLVMLSGQSVFTRFSKVPIIGNKNALEIQITQEVEQNLPFPGQDVVWDYQVLSNDDPTEADVLIVAVKKDLAEEVASCASGSGLNPTLIDSSALALYNCVRYNYPELDGCTMALDIGAKSTSLIFSEAGKFFVRSIPIGGNMITAEISKGLGISFDEAESLKLEKGFVALGGTFAIQDDEEADKCSKIIRNVVTRLHMEINRSINFYRSQHGGSAPEQILLTGGGSMTKMLSEFFAEKFGIDVEYMNPFANVGVQIDNGIEVSNEELFLLSNSVGLMLRRSVKCPVEIDLMPSTVLAARKFAKRIPFFVASALALILMVFCWNQSTTKQADKNTKQKEAIEQEYKKLKNIQSRLNDYQEQIDEYNSKSQYISEFFAVRDSYSELLNIISKSLEGGCWLEKFEINNNNELYLVILGYKDDLDIIKTENNSASEIIVQRLKDNDIPIKQNGDDSDDTDSNKSSGKYFSSFRVEKDGPKATKDKKEVIWEIELSIKLANVPGLLPGATVNTEEE